MVIKKVEGKASEELIGILRDAKTLDEVEELVSTKTDSK